ncbi:MAG: hypothetical protein EF812_03865 [Methanosarcinales archaeon]|nr:MAG: hypothetical protein EF812_03865 [Methanosarcinales archaeon]
MNMLNDRIVIVVGYHDLGEFDVIPVLFDEAHPRKIIWLINNEIEPIIENKIEVRQYIHVKADVDEFF